MSEAQVLDGLLEVRVGTEVLRLSLGGRPTVTTRLRHPDDLDRLTDRERETLALVAEGWSNAGIATRLRIRERTVEATCARVFRKLGLEHSPDVNRRVLAVLAVLR